MFHLSKYTLYITWSVHQFVLFFQSHLIPHAIQFARIAICFEIAEKFSQINIKCGIKKHRINSGHLLKKFIFHFFDFNNDMPTKLLFEFNDILECIRQQSAYFLKPSPKFRRFFFMFESIN